MANGSNKPWKSRRSLWLTRLGFLLLSAFFWFLVQLSDETHIQSLSVPVQLVNTPDDRIIVDAPTHIKVHSEASGIQALRQYWSGPQSVVLSFDAFRRRGNDEYILLNDAFEEEVNSQISNSVHWELKEDSLLLHTSSLQRKKLAVIPNLDLTYEAPYFSEGNSIVRPDSIFVFGPPDVLDTLVSIETPTFKQRNVQDDLQYRWEIILPDGLRSPTSTVLIEQRISAHTEKWIEVELRAPNTSRSWRPVPSVVQVKCRVPIRIYDDIRGNMFQAEIDKSENGNPLVGLQWTHIPEYVQILDWTPHYFEIIETR